MSKTYQNTHTPYGPYERFVKRPLDFILDLMFVLLLSWLYLIVAILVRVKLGSPVLFKQERPGMNEKIFTLYKFRTMTDRCDEHGNLLPDEYRLTKFGKALRKTSLDEIPEAFNILKGDMSLVGPRPLAVKYLPYYDNDQNRRHNVRPGLTGLAQINGRNDLCWDKRFALDVKYVNKITFWNDLMIIFKTIKKVIYSENVTTRGTGKTVDFDDFCKQNRKVH